MGSVHIPALLRVKVRLLVVAVYSPYYCTSCYTVVGNYDWGIPHNEMTFFRRYP